MIGYYVHHQGNGHLHRAQSIAAHCATPVTGLSSLAAPPGWPGDWVELPRDDDGRSASLRDVTARGRLHWAPLHHAGLRRRTATIADWIRAADPGLFVSDVSVEVAVLARLTGTPVVTVAMRGKRDDGPHRMAYDLSEMLIAPWPGSLPEPGWPARWRDKTIHTGAFSRFDDRPRCRGASSARTVLLMMGAGGADLPADAVRAARAATPGWRWTTLGGPGGSWASDPWPALCTADVVVTHAGQNAVAECAAAGKPAVVVPQERPYGEQHATARALRRAGLAVVAEHWPAARDWPALLTSALALGGEGWHRWAPGDGAPRAASALHEAASDQRRRAS